MQNLDGESALVRRSVRQSSVLAMGRTACIREEDILPKRLKAIPWAEWCIHFREGAYRSASQTVTPGLLSIRNFKSGRLRW
jgi:hypothetical protein